ncbi:MAG: pyridoxamine 5'-phosphate oxidase family protein [Pseudomonadota bacterium]
MDSFGDIMFTPAVQAEQERDGSREKYERMYRSRLKGPLDADARAFIESRDTFYMATITETGWPYVQHRGGPPGFLKVLGPEEIGFSDYAGNRQFITKGNLNGSNRVSIILMDYPRRARLKVIGHAKMIDAGADEVLAKRLATDGASAPQRLVTIAVSAIDWNCPKYITPRLTEAEIETSIGPRILQMAEKIKMLEARLDRAEPSWREGK